MEDVTTYADEHEGGQLRLGAAGDQRPLLVLPDSAIPTSQPARVDVDEAPAAIVEPLEGQQELLEPCPTCEGLGFQAGAHTERVEPCPTCGGNELEPAGVRVRDVAELKGDPLAELSTSDIAELHRQRVEGHTSRRERLEHKAEKRREWADSRTRKAAATDAAARAKLDVIPFGQPVHGARDTRYREKAREGLFRAHEHRQMAHNHEQKADGLEEQLAGAIYSDDVDAVERLEEKLARLEQQRETMKARNADYRREHRAELKAMGAYERSQAVPHASYELQNLGGNITRTRQRLEQLKRAAVIVAAGGRGRGRPMVSRFSSSCADCGESIEKGSSIVYYKLTREAVHAKHVEKEG